MNDAPVIIVHPHAVNRVRLRIGGVEPDDAEAWLAGEVAKRWRRRRVGKERGEERVFIFLEDSFVAVLKRAVEADADWVLVTVLEPGMFGVSLKDGRYESMKRAEKNAVANAVAPPGPPKRQPRVTMSVLTVDGRERRVTVPAAKADERRRQLLSEPDVRPESLREWR